MTTISILALGGDGIGPEILAQGLRIARHVAEKSGFLLDIDHDLLHGASYDTHGVFCTDAVLDKAKAADAVLVGAVGGHAWDHVRIAGGAEAQDGLMYLRYHLQAYLGLRPAEAWKELSSLSPFRCDVVAGADIMIMREMCGGAMFARQRGQRIHQGKRQGYDLTAYDEDEVARFAHGGFALARRRRRQLVSCDKSNVMESYKLWRDVVGDVAKHYPDVEFKHMLADHCAYQMMMQPTAFDVVLCCNQLGDVFSDLTGTVSGSLGMLPSACLASNPADGPSFGIYESTSGSAPDIAGKGIANPIGMILSVAMMFDYTIGRPDLWQAVHRAIEQTLADGIKTQDIGGTATTVEITDAILDRLVA